MSIGDSRRVDVYMITGRHMDPGRGEGSVWAKGLEWRGVK